MSWVSPTGYDNTLWTYEFYAYDDDLGSSAFSEAIFSGWTSYLILNISPSINTDKIRIYLFRSGISTVEIDLYNGTWTNVYSGVPAVSTWVEITFTQINNVSKVRIRGKYVSGIVATLYVTEFDFWKLAALVARRKLLGVGR